MVNKKVKARDAEPLWARPPLKLGNIQSMVHRTGALKVLEMPSRMSNTLFYPDGRVVKDIKET
jgi:hypothetical protein